MKKYNVAVVGATGLVGGEMINVLKQRNFPVAGCRFFASHRSAGKKIEFKDREVLVEDIENCDPSGIHIALFAGGSIASIGHAPRFVKAGAVVVDNSKTFRMDPDVPLVVPEVNPEDLKKHNGIIANPNCSTIQMVVVLKPVYDKAGLERVIVSTYQAVAGTGKAALEEMKEQALLYLGEKYDEIKALVYPHQIAFNLLPHIGSFEDDGYTSEEHKMIFETRKILGDESIRISATTVRVCTEIGHCESINIETKKTVTVEEVRELMRNAPGVTLVDEPGRNLYPHALMCAGNDDVYIGRIRKDLSCENGLEVFIAADNLRKGAALNAVQIAEKMIEMNLI